MSYSSEVMRDNPVMYLRAGESSSPLADSSGNGNTATELGTVIYTQPPLVISDPQNASVLLRGGSECLIVNDSISLTVGNNYTLEGWVQFRSIGANHYIFDKGGDGVGGAYNLRINGGLLQTDKSTVADLAFSSVALTIGRKYHCVATKSATEVHLFLNGVDVTVINNFQTVTDYNNELLIGQNFIISVSSIDGWLDELAVYGTVLTPDRIRAHYDAALATPNFMRRAMAVR